MHMSCDAKFEFLKTLLMRNQKFEKHYTFQMKIIVGIKTQFNNLFK